MGKQLLNWSIVWAPAPAPEGDLLLLLPGRNSQVSFGSTCAYALSVIKRHKVVMNMLSLPNPLSQKIRNLLSYELLIINGGPVAHWKQDRAGQERGQERGEAGPSYLFVCGIAASVL